MPSQLGLGGKQSRHCWSGTGSWRQLSLCPCLGKARSVQHQLQTYLLHMSEMERQKVPTIIAIIRSCVLFKTLDLKPEACIDFL